MKVIAITESIELCTEAGWHAYDLALDQPMDKKRIQLLGTLGDLTYLGMLAKPFYRIEHTYIMIKGLEGDKIFRVAMYQGEEEIIERVKKLIEA